MGDGIKGILKFLQRVPKTTAGTIFTNIKKPATYELPGKKNIIDYAANVLEGDTDKPVWNTEMNTSYPARDFLNRKMFGFRDKSANRLGGMNAFNKLGENEYEFNPNDAYGKSMIEDIDGTAKQWLNAKKDETMLQDIPTDEKGQPIYNSQQVLQNRRHPVMSNYGFELGGEGEDEKGYYNIVKGVDPWDFKRHGDEPLLSMDNDKSYFENVKKTGTNVLRDLANMVTTPQNVNYGSKVYIPGIKKQPRKKKVLRIPGADVMNPDI